MKISIITVCYNSEATIQDTIESVLAQTHSNIEYIIIDGASSDDTLSIINKYKDKVSKLVSEPDKGIYDAMNKGVQLATGDVVGILNSDDFFESEDVVEAIVKCFKQNPNNDLIFGDVVFVNPNKLDKITRHYSAKHFKMWKLRFGWMPPHPATFIRKTAYQKTGLYSLNYKIAADYEMFIRLLMVNHLKFSYLNKVLVRMRAGGVSTSGLKSSILLNREIVKTCRSNGIYTNILMVLIKIPFKLLELIRKPAT